MTAPTAERDVAHARTWSDDSTHTQTAKPAEEYPPVHDDQLEARRIQENLQRMEERERQRRKAARESVIAAPSVVGDVSRMLFQRKAPGADPSLGKHAALGSGESLPLDPLVSTPTISRTSSPVPPENPFANPTSPFSDEHQITPKALGKRKQDEQATRPALLQSTSSFAKTQPTETPPPTFDTPKSKEPKVRWWHDWLCGCSEGPDRGGEYQAGRTNPYE